MIEPDEVVRRVFEAMLAGRLRRSDLTARGLSTFVGASTIVLYHHFGSLEGFLIRVDGLAWKHLLARLTRREQAGGTLAALAAEYLDFAFDHPDVYWLMAERRFDRAALRRQNRLRLGPALWDAFVKLVERHGASQPQLDAHVLFAGLHGLAALAASERGNLGEGPEDTRRLAQAAAARLVDRLLAPEPGRRRPRPSA